MGRLRCAFCRWLCGQCAAEDTVRMLPTEFRKSVGELNASIARLTAAVTQVQIEGDVIERTVRAMRQEHDPSSGS